MKKGADFFGSPGSVRLHRQQEKFIAWVVKKHSGLFSSKSHVVRVALNRLEKDVKGGVLDGFEKD